MEFYFPSDKSGNLWLFELVIRNYQMLGQQLLIFGAGLPTIRNIWQISSSDTTG